MVWTFDKHLACNACRPATNDLPPLHHVHHHHKQKLARRASGRAGAASDSPLSLGLVHGLPFAFKSCEVDGSPGSSGEQRSSTSSPLLLSSLTECSLRQPGDSAVFSRVNPLAVVALHIGTLRRGCRSLQRSCPGSGAPALKDTDDVQLEEVFELCLSDVLA